MTTAVAATDALVIKALLPLRTHSPFLSSARVASAPASEPEPGSVRPQAPSVWPAASDGRYFRFCSGDPKAAMWLAQSELCAHIVMPTDASPRQSSSTISA